MIIHTKMGISMGIRQGEVSGELGITPLRRVVPKMAKLFTELSTRFSTLLAEFYPRIHRPYYYNYLYLRYISNSNRRR